MAFDPHVTRKAARPSPVLSGGWVGRGKSIVPYGSFDLETLREAIAIVEGTSSHYRFNREGTLQRLSGADESVDDYYARIRFRGQFRERAQNAAAWQQAIDEEHSVRRQRIDEDLRPVVEARVEHHQALQQLRQVFEGVHPDGTPYFDMLAYYEWEQAQKANPDSTLAKQVMAKQRSDAATEPDRFELGEIADDRRVSSRDRKLLQDFHDFDALVERLHHLPEQIASADIWQSSAAKKEAEELWERLVNAVKLFDDESYTQARKRLTSADQAGEATSDAGLSEEADFQKRLKFFNFDGNRTPDTMEVLRATLSILANAALKQGFEPQEAIELRVRSPDSPFGRGMEALGRRFNVMTDENGDPVHSIPPDLDNDWCKKSLREMESDIQQLRRLDAGAQAPTQHAVPDDDDFIGDPEAAEYHNGTRWDKKRLLRKLMNDAEERLEGEHNLMRFHNQFPEAVNFILASHEGDFLTREDGQTRDIRNLASFLNSYWMSLAGEAEIKVEPELLQAARLMLKTQPSRPLANQPSAASR